MRHYLVLTVLVATLTFASHCAAGEGSKVGGDKEGKLVKKSTEEKKVELSISVPESVVAGEAIPLEISLRNGEKTDVIVQQGTYYRTYDITVLDNNRKEVPYTRFGQKEVRIPKGTRPPSFLDELVSTKLTLRPGASYKVTHNLSHVFDLTLPGNYRVSVAAVAQTPSLEELNLKVADLEFCVRQPTTVEVKEGDWGEGRQGNPKQGDSGEGRQRNHKAFTWSSTDKMESHPIEALVGSVPQDMAGALEGRVRLEFKAETLSNAVMWLNEVARARTLLFERDIPKDCPTITLTYDGSVAGAVDQICRIAGLGWKVEQGIVKIGSRERLKLGVSPRVGAIPPAMQQSLGARVALSFDGRSLKDVTEFLGEVTKVEFNVLPQEPPVDLPPTKLHFDGTIEECLNLVCELAGVSWKAEGNVITIGRPERLNAHP